MRCGCNKGGGVCLDNMWMEQGWSNLCGWNKGGGVCVNEMWMEQKWESLYG